ncbi:MAG: Uma2 family endonuclease [Cyanobacteria bacterium J06639_1]
MTVTTYRWTVDRFHRAIDAGLFDDQPVELLNGDLFVMPPERELHAFSNSEVGDYFRKLLGDLAKVREAHPVTLNEESELVPDLAIVKPLGREYLEHHPYPEDIYWVVEFSKATLAKDLGTKKSAYARAGIREYWVVDLVGSRLLTFTDLEGEGYRQERTSDRGTVSPIAFPDIDIRVDRLLLA